MDAIEFRFDASAHEYLDAATGELFPHITGMLEDTGWIDDRWYTEESSDRGLAAHALTAAYDLGALHVESCQSKVRSYLLAHVKALSIIKPKILAVEEPLVHPRLLFGGRPDRDIIAYGMRGVLEIKSGAPERSHQIQTALQTILIGHFAKLPPESLIRLCLYLKENGKFKLERHIEKRDYAEAQRVIRACCRW